MSAANTPTNTQNTRARARSYCDLFSIKINRHFISFRVCVCVVCAFSFQLFHAVTQILFSNKNSDVQPIVRAKNFDVSKAKCVLNVY